MRYRPLDLTRWLCISLCLALFTLNTTWPDIDNHAHAATSQPTSLPTRQPMVQCGLSKAQRSQPRRLLAMARIADLPGLIAGLSWATHKGWLKQLDVQKLQSASNFLQGRMIKLLGLQWSRGIWVTIYERKAASNTKPTPLSWMPTHRKGIHWSMATRALERLEITIGVNIKKSYWLNITLDQLLGLTGLTSYRATLGGHKTYWFQLRHGAAVLVVTDSQLLVRFLWRDKGIDDEAGRQQLWQHDVSNSLDALQSNDAQASEQRISSNFPTVTQGLLYLHPKVLCHWLRPLPFPFKKGILQTLATIDAYALGARLSPSSLRLDQRLWKPKPTRRPPATPPPPSIARWLPATTRWMTTIDATRYPIHQLFALFSPPPPQSFYGRLQRALHQVLQSRQLVPMGTWLWQDAWQQWWLEATMFQRTITWMESPAITAEMQRLPHGYLATGRWPAGAKALITSALARIPKIQRVGTFGQTPTFVYTQPNRRTIAITWRGQRWFMASHIGLLQRLVQHHQSKAKGTMLRFAKGGSLLQLQGWNKHWNVMHLNPARMGCLWQPGLSDAWTKQIARHIEHIEVASLATPAQDSATIRLGWKQGGLLPPTEAYPKCWDGSAWWRRMGLISWAMAMRSPIAQIIRPIILPHLPRLKAAIKARKAATKTRAKHTK